MRNIMTHARETIHAVAVTTMLVIAELQAQQARCVQRIMEIQDQLHAETALIGADLDQIAGLQAQASASEARQFCMEEQKKK
jgi:hypothetical protein